MKITHKFVGKVYAKQVEMDTGEEIVTHTHNYHHLSIVAKGRVACKTGSSFVILQAGECLEVLAGVPHQILALEPVVWYCLHNEDHNQHLEGK